MNLNEKDMKQALWCEKYRPHTIDDCVLPDDLKNTFNTFVKNRDVPNLLLCGSAGVGKTTVAKAMLDEIGCNFLVINSSKDGGIDTLRNQIESYASGMSLTGGRKFVILDEADYLNPNSTQPALRNFMETYASNCGFILTCNYPNRIIPPLQSRCAKVEFNFGGELKTLGSKFMNRLDYILNNEGIKFDPKVLGKVVKKYYPDFRRILNELQRYSVTGKIDSGILSNRDLSNSAELFRILKEKDFSVMTKWILENSDIDTDDLFRKIFDNRERFIKKELYPELVVVLGEYQYKHAFVADRQLNIMACLTEIMTLT